MSGRYAQDVTTQSDIEPHDKGDAEPTHRDAATLVIFRQSAGGPAPLLMLERSTAMRFAGGAAVFPGGTLDPGDHSFAASFDHGLDPVEAACRIAAIRETVEEAGIAIGLLGLMPDRLEPLRAALVAGQDFGALLTALDITPDLDMLTPFARWRPNGGDVREPVRRKLFDTRFYLAGLPDDAPDPTVDATENSRLFWATAQETLDLAQAGQVRIIYPTRRNLERLAQFDSHDAARDHAHAFPVRTITPWLEDRDGARWLCIPDDIGYPVCGQILTDVQRG